MSAVCRRLSRHEDGCQERRPIAWLITAVYYFYQYMLRSAPSVMMPQLADAFSLTTMSVAAMAGLFYYGYSPFSLVAGVALDRFGPRKVVPIGAAAVGIGALMFATGDNDIASAGRLLQGAGGVFALVGAVYIATTNFPGFARRDIDRRDADVRHGRRLGRPVHGRARDRGRSAVESLLDRHGRRRPRHQRGFVRAVAEARTRTDSGASARTTMIGSVPRVVRC